MWPALRMATEKNVRRRARASSSSSACARSRMCARASAATTTTSGASLADAARTGQRRAGARTAVRKNAGKESQTCSGGALPPSSPLPENRPSASASPSPLFPLPNQFGRAVGVERKQERPRVVRPLLDPPAASSSPPLHPVSTRSAVRLLARFRPFLQRCWIEIKTPLLLLRPRSDRSE